MSEYPWYMNLFNMDLIEQKNKEWEKEADKKGMTLDEYLYYLKITSCRPEIVIEHKEDGEGISMVSNLVERLRAHANELNQYYDRDYTIKLLKESADTIEVLSEKSSNHNFTASKAHYEKKLFAVVQNLPNYPLEKYTVVRPSGNDLWFYGTYESGCKALSVATELGNGIILEGGRMMVAHCLFEQSGTFKNEFKKLGIEAYDYDIQNEFNETDYVVDLFEEIRGV